MGFDLKANNLTDLSEEGFEFELKFPGSVEPTGAFVTVRGSDAPKVKAHFRKTQAQLEQRKKSQRLKDQDLTPDELDDLLVEAALVRIKSWRGIENDGETLPFTEDNARMVLTEHEWIRSQVIEESNTVGNFTMK